MSSYGPDELTRWFDAGSFEVEAGEALPRVRVAYRTWGRLNGARDNVIVVCHALTGDANADRWWTGMVGPGRALDCERYFVVCANVLGSCYGTTGPTTLDAESGRPYGPDFPQVTIRDMVRLQRLLLAELGVASIALVVGGSMGAMQALEWAAMYPDLVRGIAPIAVGADHSPWCIGWSEAQRQAIFADSDWNSGRYEPHHQPVRGMSVARQIGMVSYRSAASFKGKFARRHSDDGFEVESYLRYQGGQLVDRFDANTYVTLTYAMDSHDMARGRGTKTEALAAITVPALVVGITSDVLYPVAEQQELAGLLGGGRYVELDVPHGHDGFLIEAELLGELVAPFLEEVSAHKVVPLAAGKGSGLARRRVG